MQKFWELRRPYPPPLGKIPKKSHFLGGWRPLSETAGSLTSFKTLISARLKFDFYHDQIWFLLCSTLIFTMPKFDFTWAKLWFLLWSNLIFHISNTINSLCKLADTQNGLYGKVLYQMWNLSWFVHMKTILFDRKMAAKFVNSWCNIHIMPGIGINFFTPQPQKFFLLLVSVCNRGFV